MPDRHLYLSHCPFVTKFSQSVSLCLSVSVSLSLDGWVEGGMVSSGNVRKHLALRPQKPLRLIRDGEVEGSGILFLTPTRYTVTTRMILH